MAVKSDFQIVNRGSKWKACWTVEKSGQYCYSSAKKGNAQSYLALMRDLERKEHKAHA